MELNFVFEESSPPSSFLCPHFPFLWIDAFMPEKWVCVIDLNKLSQLAVVRVRLLVRTYVGSGLRLNSFGELGYVVDSIS